MTGPEERGGRGAGGSGEAQAQGQPRDSAMAPMQPSLGPPRDEPRLFGLDKFNDDNFAEWSFKMENIFDHYDLLEVMEGTEKRPENDPEKSPWVRKSAQGYLLLGQALGSSQIRHIKPFQREPEKGPNAWAALKGVHAPATAAIAVVLERQMAALRIEEDEAVEEGVQKFFDLLTRLEGDDLNYSELQKKTKLLALLPESWSLLIINLNRDLPRFSLEDMKRAILQEDFRRHELASADGAGAASIGRGYGQHAVSRCARPPSVDWTAPASASASLDSPVSPVTHFQAGAEDGGVHQFTPAYERVTHCTCARTGRHLATFTRQPGSDLYTLTTVSPQVAASASASASGQLSAPCSCRSLAHETVLWHHRLGHPSVQRLRAMHSRYLVSGLPRVLPPLPPLPAPPCLPCVEGRQRAAPHSSSFPPTTAPLQTLHIDVWGPARVRGQGQERYFLIVVDDYSRYTTVFPLRTKGECAEHGIEQSFTLLASPQQNGVVERRIGLVMEVARTSLIHAAAPHFLWPFVVRYVAHQLNLWPRVSLPETSPTLLWTGEVGDASRFRVWGSRAFVCDTSADKLSSRAVPCVFLGFIPDAPGWQFYHATSRRVLPSQNVTFDESVPYYRLFPYRTAPLPPPPLFLAPRAAVVDPLPPQGAAPSGVSQVDPVEPVEVAVDSRPAAGVEPEGAEPGGAEPGGAELGGAESGGAEPGGAEPGGAEPGGAESGGTEPWGTEPGGTEPRSLESGGPASRGPVPESPTPGGALSSEQLREWYLQYCSLRRGTSGARRTTGAGTSASPPRRELPSRDQIREWYERRCTLWSGAPGVTDPGAAGTAAGAAGPGVGAAAGTEDPGVGAAAGAEDPGAGAAAGAVEPGVGAATGAEDPGADAAAGAVESGVGAAAGAGDPGVGAATGAEDPGVGAAAGAEDPGTGDSAGSGVAARRRPYFVPLLQQVLGLPPSTGPPPPSACPQPFQSQLELRPASPLPALSPYTGPTGGLAERREPASRPASPIRTARTSGCGSRLRPPPVPGTHRMSLRLSTAPLRAPLPSPPESSLPALSEPESDSLRAASPTVTRLLATVVTDPSFESTAASALVAELVDFAARCRLDYAASLVAESESVCPPSVRGECALGTDVLEDRQEEFQCLAAASPRLVSVLLTPEGDPDALDIPTPRSYAEAIEGPYSSQWQAAMDAEMASWKSTGTYVDAVPHPGANIVSGMWIFRVKRPPGSPPVFKARYVARGFSQRQGVDYFQTFSPTPKMTTLRLRRPPGFTGTSPPGTQWSLRRPVYGLRQAPREWHDTLRTTLAALGFAPSTADPSLFLRTDTSLPPFYILVYCSFLHRLSLHETRHEVRDESCVPVVPEQQMHVLTSSCSAERFQTVVHPLGDDQATQRSSQGYTFSLGSGSVSWRATRSSSVLGSSCEAEIYAEAMAAQELRWLTYLLTDLGEPPRSPPVLYVDNKAMLALCREQRLEHRTKHIALRYFLARELQQCGQLRLAYVASEANTADVFTKALAPCDHQRFCTQLACFALPYLTGLVTPSSPPLRLWGGVGGGRGRGRGGRGGRGGGAASMKSAGNESESRDDRFPGQFFFVSTHAPAGPEKDEGFEEPAAVGKVTLHSLDYWVIDSGATYSMTPRADLLTELAANLISVRRLQKVGMDTSSKGAKTYTARLGERILWDIHKDRDVYNKMWQIPVVPMPKERVKHQHQGKLGEHEESGAAAQKQHNDEENPKAAAEEEYGENMWGTIASAAFSNLTSATGECDWLTLHRRMGHVALPILQQLVKNEMVAGIRVKGEPDEVLGCPTCMQAKFTRFPFSSSEATAKAPLHEVVMDAVGPLKLGAAGAEYFLTILDVYTHMTWVYVLSKKSDVVETVKTDWLPMVERQQDRLVKAIRTDRGGEFLSKDFSLWLNKNGIRHSLTMPYSPAMNGIAERANRTITETTRGLLIEAGLPDYFWPDAVRSACVAKNRALTHVGADKWVPYVEWIGRKPKVDMLRVFGCMCMALVPKHLRHNKLGAKAIWAVHLGMAQNSKGWLLWDPFTKKFLVSRDCKFMENLMYKDWKAENEVKIGMRFGEVKSSGLEHVELPLELSSGNTTTRQSSLVNGGEEAKDAEEEEEEVQQVSERAPTLPSRTTSAPRIRVTPQQRQGLHVPAPEEEGRGKRRIQAPNRLTYDALGKPAKSALAGAALIVGDDEESDYEECAFAFFSPVEMPGEPATLKEALESSDAEEWKKAMESELKSIEENGTWELVELPEGRKAIASKWLFKIKSDADGKIERYKSRLVAKGYQQKEKVDYKELFAPVVKPMTLRTLLAGAAIKGWVVKQMDVTTAFLNVAPRQWYLKLQGVLEEIGFTPSTADHSLFMLGEGEQRSFMVVYVDDILIFSPSSDLVKEVMQKLQDKFKCKALGDVNFYLGLHIERDMEKRCMRVHQRKYLEALAAKFGQSEGHVATPFPSGFKCVKGPEEESVGEEERRRFHSLVGSLMYAAVNTRPDVAFATGQLARIVQYPNEEQVAAGMRVAKYLGQTPTVGLQYSAAAQRRQKGADGVEPGHLFFTAFSDASYASEPEDMTSVGGFIRCVGGGPTAWESKKQVDQALSSVESEYMTLFRAVREIVWQRRLLAELGEEQKGPTPL
ncbi:unnamed protein product [Closterium sp. NIES-53]